MNKTESTTAINSTITAAVLVIITTLCLTSKIDLTDKIVTGGIFGALTAGYICDAVRAFKAKAQQATR